MAHTIQGHKNRYKNDSSRTFALTAAYADNIINGMNTLDAYTALTDDEKNKLRTALLYLQNHDEMITYKFDDHDKLNKIILGPTLWTIFTNSRELSCDHMRILYKFFKKSFEHYNIDVQLSERCPSAAPAAASGSGGPNVETNVETSETNGGYKSRRRNRKPARKTRRRGRGRGRDRRGKSHHKKYTH